MDFSPLASPSRRGSVTCGFSTLELLVTLAVLVALVVLSFPLSGQIRETQRNLQCLANLRETAIGMQLYIADRNHQLVAFKAGTFVKTPLWGACLYQGGYLKDYRTLYCPAGPQEGGFLTKEKSASWWYTYGLNLFDPRGEYGDNISDKKDREQIYTLSMSRVDNPGQTIMLGDSLTNDKEHQSFRLGGNEGKLSYLDLRHRDKANVVFFDGHADSITRTEAEAQGVPAIHP
ncbi:MAG TPA: hypothetical protein VNQ90_10560 [Chthoniobacteraceae bacterium]|nr:hypothetical protein [Chthoniobacteraceae bacterium]